MKTDAHGSFVSAAALLPKRLRGELLSLCPEDMQKAEEIRLRLGRRLSICGEDRRLFEGCTVTAADMEEVLLSAAGSSIHRHQKMLEQGFMTAPGGHRVGICGGMNAGESPFSLNIRIAKDIRGASGRLSELFPGCKGLLIISPPGEGKTTALRDLARKLSYRTNVAVCDEREEVFPMAEGRSVFDCGECDVLHETGKYAGIEMLLRTMSPRMIAFDEITSETDCEAVINGVGSGCIFIATAHASSDADLKKRPIYRRLIESGAFSHIALLKRENGKRTAEIFCPGGDGNAENCRRDADGTVMYGCGDIAVRIGKTQGGSS